MRSFVGSIEELIDRVLEALERAQAFGAHDTKIEQVRERALIAGGPVAMLFEPSLAVRFTIARGEFQFGW